MEDHGGIKKEQLKKKSTEAYSVPFLCKHNQDSILNAEIYVKLIRETLVQPPTKVLFTKVNLSTVRHLASQENVT